MTPRWRWELTSSASRDLGRLVPEQRQRVVERLEDLVAVAPTLDLKMIGNDEFRMRVGKLRIIFARDFHERRITAPRIADRKEAYR